MPGNRQPGMDHEFYDWSPIASRPRIAWPDDAPVALCVIVSLEHYEWDPPEDAFMRSSLPGGLGRGAYPDIRSHSHREYGNRVGIFRLMEILDRHGIRGTAAIDATVAEHCPAIVAECQRRGWEFIGHGVSVNRMITSNMPVEQEREYIGTSIETVSKATGSRPKGWLGPEYGESHQTLALLEAEGIQYVCDWPNDEQPYPIGRSRSMYALPIIPDLDDVASSWTRNTTIMEWSRLVQEAFDVLYEDGGRALVLNLHPWFIGQPFRAKYLDQALRHIVQTGNVWKATGSEIVEWYAAHRHRPGGAL